MDTAARAMTDLTDVAHGAFDGLLDTAAEQLAVVPAHLFVHEFLAAPMYGVTDLSAVDTELETRTAAGLVGRILARNPAPLVVPRQPADRVVGNCRQFALLGVALLRRAGVSARLRGGFAGYFGDGWTDHWIIERRAPHTNVWVRTDGQLDDVQRQTFGIDFDHLDVPRARFVTGAEAWHRCRAGDDDPDRYGIGDLRGEWFIACNAIRDLAALTGTEPHVWDTWGIMDDIVGTSLTDDARTLVDAVADAVVIDDPDALADIASHPALAVPETVTSHRTGRRVRLG